MDRVTNANRPRQRALRTEPRREREPAGAAQPVSRPPVMFPQPSRNFAPRVWLLDSGRGSAPLRKLVLRMRGGREIVSEAEFQTAAHGRPSDFQRAVLELCIDEIHVAAPPQGLRDRLGVIKSAAHDVGVMLAVHRLAAEPGGAVSRSAADRTRVEYFNRHAAVQGPRSKVKRALDLLVGSVALAAAAPLFAVIALAIKATSPGPVFFRQTRIGRGRRQFKMFKFRTMVQNAEELRHAVQSMNHARGISFKVIGDPRLTRIGSLLRRSSLDELPQLINVLRGDMSLVGPRPIPVWVAEQLQQVSYFRRFSVAPGLTGLWQVKGRIQDFDRMAELDLEYVDTWTLGLDLKILAKTLPAVVRAEGAH